MKPLLLFVILSITSIYQVKSQQINRSDTLFKINPIIEIKKGVLVQSVGLIIFGATTVSYLVKKPSTDQQYMNYGILYGTSAVCFFVGSVYVIQGLNYLYKPTDMGHWSFNVSPLNTTVSYRF